MNQPSHLTDAEIKDFVKDSTTGLEAGKPLEGHLADCESCLHRLLDAERVHLGLLEGDGMKRTPYPGCPAEETLQELAAGICPPDTAQTTTEHAAQCNFCGPLLGKYLKEFSEEPTTEDTTVLQQLESSKPRWQKKFIRENVICEDKKSWFTFWPTLATAAAGIAVVAGLFIFLRRPDDLSQAQQLVASAYAERRTIEMRFPSVRFATFQPPGVERSSDGAVDWTSQPAPLLNAEVLLNKKRTVGELSPQWLEIKGRIDILEAQPTSAKKAAESFEEAARRDPSNVDLKIDLAVAYFEAEMQAAPEHPALTRTIDLLNQVLKSPTTNDQQKATVLFDLAIAYENSNVLDLAVATWEQYLRVDPSGPWSDEARSRLQKAKEKIPDPKLQSYVNSKDPSFFLTNAFNPVVLQNVEEYQETALAAWLPDALKNPRNDSSQAIRKLADLLEQQHSDSWLRDFFEAAKPSDLKAVLALSTAVSANQQGLYSQALAESKVADRAFAQSKNLAGELQARFQEVYALRSMLQGRDCLEYAIPLQKQLSMRKYPWLGSQLSLEEAQCRNFLSDRTNSARDIQTSSKTARNAGFRVLDLRIRGISASIQRQQGKCRTAWANEVNGLRDYWEGTYPSIRLVQFYGVMWQCASEGGYSYAAEALLRQTIEIRRSPDIPRNDVRDGVLHVYLSEILGAQGDTAAAKREKASGMALFSSVSEEYSKVFKLATDIEPAEHQLQSQNAELALATLKPVAELLEKTQDNFFSLRFYRLLGNIHLRLRHLEQAYSAYNSAIQMAELSVADVKSDTERLEWLHATGESYRGLVRVLLEEKREGEALARWEWYKSRPLLHATLETDSGPGARRQERIATQAIDVPLPRLPEPRLIYATFEDGLQIWVYRDGRVWSVWVPVKRTALVQEVREFARQCSTATSNISALQVKGGELYSLLLRPIISDLPDKGIIVTEPDDPVSDLSFGALRTPSGRYLEEEYSIIYSPGIWMEKNLRPPRPISTQEIALLVDGSHSSESGNLPGTSIERNAISDLFPRLTVVDSEATSWASLRSKVAASEVFIFMGHGRTEGDGAVLVLNSTESVAAKDFSREILNHQRLAVLSACSTGVGHEDGFLDTDNLVRSFLSAGVPNVVASRWNVDSKTTAKLMTRFYTYLRQGKAVVQAMADARRDILRNAPHPYYWAAFSLEGRAS